MKSVLRAITGALVGAAAGATLAWLSCGSISYVIDPEPEMIHPFFFAANLGAVIGAPIGCMAGAIYALVN